MFALFQDIKAIKRNDPACAGFEILLYPSLHTMIIHRLLARPMYILRFCFFARLFSQLNRFLTGVEIHPWGQDRWGLFY